MNKLLHVVALLCLFAALALFSVQAHAKRKHEREGSLPKGKIMSVIKANKKGIMDCYEMAKIRKAQLEGSVTARWKIYPEGEVQSCDITQSTVDDKEMESCICFEIGRWVFAKPKGGVVTVTFPFHFKYVEPKVEKAPEDAKDTETDILDEDTKKEQPKKAKKPKSKTKNAPQSH
jgi:hypothetical protein